MFTTTISLAPPPAPRENARTIQRSDAGCGFALGTKVQTICGPRSVERLMAGDLLLDATGQIVELRGLRHRKVSTDDLIQIDPSALGLGMAPGDLMRPLIVAAGQCIAVHDWRSEVLFGKPVLTPAQKLVDGVHVHRNRANSASHVLELSFDQPTILLANGLRALVTPNGR